jgi:hypothetical protein
LSPFDELEPPGKDEVYVHDLIGMKVELDAGGGVAVPESRSQAATRGLPKWREETAAKLTRERAGRQNAGPLPGV